VKRGRCPSKFSTFGSSTHPLVRNTIKFSFLVHPFNFLSYAFKMSSAAVTVSLEDLKNGKDVLRRMKGTSADCATRKCLLFHPRGSLRARFIGDNNRERRSIGVRPAKTSTFILLLLSRKPTRVETWFVVPAPPLATSNNPQRRSRTRQPNTSQVGRVAKRPSRMAKSIPSKALTMPTVLSMWIPPSSAPNPPKNSHRTTFRSI
jgi:hypothetical protein